MKRSLVLALFAPIMEEAKLEMSLKDIFPTWDQASNHCSIQSLVEWHSKKNENDKSHEYGMFNAIFQECEVDVLWWCSYMYIVFEKQDSISCS
jgi:hypothetical protein